MKPSPLEGALLGMTVLTGIAALMAVGASRTVAIHWNAGGDANGFAPAIVALSLAPLFGIAIVMLRNAMPYLDPLGPDNLLRAGLALRRWSAATLGILLTMQCLIAADGTGLLADGKADAIARRALPVSMAAVLVVIGNVLGKVRRNSLVGVRTPWTRASDTVWDRTQRFAGRLGVMLGTVALAACCALPVRNATYTIIAVYLVFGAGSYVRSYFYWREEAGALRP